MTLSEALNRFRRIRSLTFWCASLLRLISGNLAALLLLFILDNLLAFSRGTRISLLCVIAVLNLAAWFRLFRKSASLRHTRREDALDLEKMQGIRDNALVNAVCFQDDTTLPPHLASHFSHTADQRCQDLRIPGLRQAPPFRRALKALGSITLAALLYALPFFRHAQNAFHRFRNPWSNTAALNYVRFDITPGNCRIPRGNSVTLRARAYRKERELSGLQLLLESEGTPVLHPLSSEGFVIKSVSGNLKYRIKAGGEESERFAIKVLEPPMAPGFTITFAPPAYTALPRETLTPGAVFQHSAPEGTAISIHCDDASAQVFADDKPVQSPFILQQDVSLRLSLKNKEGLRFDNAWSGTIRCVKDAPPEIRFLNEKTNVEAGYGEGVPLRILAGDDFGVASIQILSEADGKSRLLKEFAYPSPGPKRKNEVFMLKITPALLPENGSMEIRAAVIDTKGQKSASAASFTIHYLNLLSAMKEALAAGDAAKCFELLLAALREETATRDRISQQLKNFPAHQIPRLLRDQNQIANRIRRAHTEAEKAQLQKGFLSTLSQVSKKADALARQVVEMQHAPDSTKLNTIVLDQTALIDALRRLLGALALRQRQEENKKELAKSLEAEKEFLEQLKGLKEKLERFQSEQRKVISDTEAFDPKKADDWTEKEEALLGKLAAREQEWAQLLKSAFTDLSKAENQDFSNSAMADEFSELYEELQKAGDALKAKNIEIATLAENTAMAGAANMKVNLERWLADKQDHIKWTAEEDGLSQDTKLTDLPAELTDIIGELIEQEEDMGEDTQDSTNSFSYDSDDGLGWGVSDGNIDSMQAKGITGNVLPNNNEVGGRSGEGRSGKSSGQFVEKEATGKGGRKTPTRLVQSPFEKGTVDDKSTDPQGGATGGGKQSGVGDEGLSGVTPDQDQKTGLRLQGHQAELRQRTQAVLKRLQDSDLPTGDLQEALSKMRALERLGNGSGPEARQIRNQVAASLANARTALEITVKAERESISKRQQKAFAVKYKHNEKVPPAYEEYVGEYFKAMAIEETGE